MTLFKSNTVLPEEFTTLRGDGVFLSFKEFQPPDKAWGRVALYRFGIHEEGCRVRAGLIDLRAGTTRHIIHYGGQIGYCVKPGFRGKSLASKACLLIAPVARYLGFEELWITCNPENQASRRTCTKIGAQLVETIPVPPGNDLYARGERWKCRYLWKLY